MWGARVRWTQHMKRMMAWQRGGTTPIACGCQTAGEAVEEGAAGAVGAVQGSGVVVGLQLVPVWGAGVPACFACMRLGIICIFSTQLHAPQLCVHMHLCQPTAQPRHPAR